MYDFVIEKPELSEETLMHYGIPGMKWGIRKQRPILGTRRFRTGTAKPAPSSQKSGRVKVKKKRKGYSDKDYQKYKAKGMSHKEAEERARKDRKKKIKKVAILAAGLTLAGAYAYKKSNTPYKGETREQMYERKKALKARNQEYKETHVKYRNQKEYDTPKAMALDTKRIQLEQKAREVNREFKNGYLHENIIDKDVGPIRVSDQEISRTAYKNRQMKKQGRWNHVKRKVGLR